MDGFGGFICFEKYTWFILPTFIIMAVISLSFKRKSAAVTKPQPSLCCRLAGEVESKQCLSAVAFVLQNAVVPHLAQGRNGKSMCRSGL